MLHAFIHSQRPKAISHSDFQIESAGEEASKSTNIDTRKEEKKKKKKKKKRYFIAEREQEVDKQGRSEEEEEEGRTDTSMATERQMKRK